MTSRVTHAKVAAGADLPGYAVVLSDFNTDHNLHGESLVPIGGTTGQALTKSTNADGATTWSTGGSFSPPIPQSDVSGLVAALAGMPRVIRHQFTYSQFVDVAGDGVVALGVTIPSGVILKPLQVLLTVAFDDSSNTDIDVTDGSANNLARRNNPQSVDTEVLPGLIPLGTDLFSHPVVPLDGDIGLTTAPIPLFARLLGWAHDGTVGTATVLIEYYP